MSGETINENASGTYTEIQASNGPAQAAFSTGTVTSIAGALSATEELLPLLDFKFLVTVGTPSADGFLTLYRKHSDQPAPTTSYKVTPIRSVILSSVATDENYYIRGIPNTDPADTFYTENQSGVTLTFSVQARGRGYNTAA